MRILYWSAMAVAGVMLLMELSFRFIEPSEQAQEHIMAIVVADLCPSVPQAREVAASSAYRYSFTHPFDLPPWWVFITANEKSPRQDEENMFAAGVCTMMLENIEPAAS